MRMRPQARPQDVMRAWRRQPIKNPGQQLSGDNRVETAQRGPHILLGWGEDFVGVVTIVPTHP